MFIAPLSKIKEPQKVKFRHIFIRSTELLVVGKLLAVNKFLVVVVDTENFATMLREI